MTKPFQSWADVAPRLIAVVAGRDAANLVITGGNLVNVQTLEVKFEDIARRMNKDWADVEPNAKEP